MKKTISIISVALIIALAVPLEYTFCQEGVVQSDIVPAGVPAATVIEEDTQYVKPGHVTVNFKDADIVAVMNYFSEVSGVDIVPAPDVTGQITMKLTDKPWDVALDILVRNYGYVLVREGDIIRVVKKEALEGEEAITEVIKLSYLVPVRRLAAVEEEGLQVEEGDLESEELSGISLLKDAIQSILKEGESATFLPSSNSFVVTAIPARINRIKAMIKEIDVMPPQIMLEAKIVEVLLTKNERMGIDWNIVIAATGARRPTTFPFANVNYSEILPHFLERFMPFGQTDTQTGEALGGGSDLVTTTGTSDFPTHATQDSTSFPFVDTDAFTYGTLDFSQFSAVLRVLKERNGTSILASPRITTLNNHEALIKVARQIFLEQVDATTMTGVTIGTSFETTPREVGVFLQVIPHINESGEVSVTLKPRADGEPEFKTITVQSGDDRVTMEYTTRMAETQVMVRDGETIFIGGLINESEQTRENKLPILGDIFGGIPIIGKAFKYESEYTVKTEIVIFVTVYIVKNFYDLNMLGSKGFSKMDLLKRAIEKGMQEPGPSEKKDTPGSQTVKTDVTALRSARKSPKPWLDFRKKKK